MITILMMICLSFLCTVTHIKHGSIGFSFKISSLEFWIRKCRTEYLWMTLHFESAVEIRWVWVPTYSTHITIISSPTYTIHHIRILIGWFINRWRTILMIPIISSFSSIMIQKRGLGMVASQIGWVCYLICASCVLNINFVEWVIICDVIKYEFLSIHNILWGRSQVCILLFYHIISTIIVVIVMMVVTSCCWWTSNTPITMMWMRLLLRLLRGIHIINIFIKIGIWALTVWGILLRLRGHIIATVMMRILDSFLIRSLENGIVKFWSLRRSSIEGRVYRWRWVNWIIVILWIHVLLLLLLLLIFVKILSLSAYLTIWSFTTDLLLTSSSGWTIVGMLLSWGCDSSLCWSVNSIIFYYCFCLNNLLLLGLNRSRLLSLGISFRVHFLFFNNKRCFCNWEISHNAWAIILSIICIAFYTIIWGGDTVLCSISFLFLFFTLTLYLL